MSEKEKPNDTLLEESSALSDSPLQGVSQSKDRLEQTVQVPHKYVLIHVYVCVCSLEMHI